ncbi:uncharacterized protein LOC124371423 [Homalodisca vitripennis]|uniref:uncharacterized protein LOC124371423 n=1 Tax=Homalodisca vitripennis TaxID=197043 RepID=UPI001EEBD4D7|nr:uncharacterized protein LOC124371423 [Homalodisca vitripennis]
MIKVTMKTLFQYDDQSVTTVKSHTILHDPSKKLTDVEENTVVYESSNKNKNTIIEGIEKVTEEETSADSNLRQKKKQCHFHQGDMQCCEDGWETGGSCHNRR